ncbi:MAG: 2-oxoglutarate dehydrogenase complex dihydrolipoyllysine-residue succinyltransferase [Parachlamydiales bacterium]|jgi:2-oxoglutarate dehydrogenase E2 component (dihydrolipoamide succinyltransferase)
MKVEIKVPRMGESISEAVIGAILKQSGSVVKADEEIVELETDKVNQVVYAPKGGQLSLTVKVGDKVPVDTVIGFVETDAESTPAKEPSTPIPVKEETKEKDSPAPVNKEEKPAPEIQVSKASDAPIRFSADAFIQELQPKPQKASTPSAQEPAPRAEKPLQPEKPRDTSERESRRRIPTIRKAIAKRLVAAQHEAAMLTTFNEVDMSAIIDIRTRFQEDFTKKYGVKLGFMSFFVEATISALKTFPLFNSYLEGEDIVQRNYYDLGIAVSTDKGLLVPVIRDCDKLTMPEIEKKLEEYAKKAREGKITIEELQGGGFTITNGGVFGSMLSTPILNAPQCGILGMHKIQKRAVVVNDEIVIRPIMYLALSYDHRLVDGKEAVSFLVHIKNMLESPPRILLEV